MPLERPGLTATATDTRTAVTPVGERSVDAPAHDEHGPLRRPTDPSAAPLSPADRDETEPTRSGKRRARKVRRILTKVDAWSVLKFSLLFYLCTFLIATVAGVLLWSAARSIGTVEGLEGFIADIGGYDFFEFDGEQIFRACFIGGLVLVVAGSAINVLLAVLFNLISDLTGGIRLTVVEEDSARPTAEPRRAPRTARTGGDGRRSRPPTTAES